MNSYFNCATILQKMESEHKSLKTIVYDDKNKGNKAEQLVIVQGILQNIDLIERISGFIKKIDPEGDVQNENLFKVLIYEMFFGRQKLKIGGKISKIVKRNKDKVLEKFKKEIVPREITQQQQRKIVHLRVLPGLSMDQLIKIDKIAKKSYLIPSAYEMEESVYKQFNKEQFPLYNNPAIVLQSKSSSLPVQVLRSHVKLNKGIIVESCSAPEYFPQHKIFSFELDPN